MTWIFSPIATIPCRLLGHFVTRLTHTLQVTQVGRSLATAHPEQIPSTHRHHESCERMQVIDFVAGMSDRHALRLHDELFRPSGLV